MVKYDIESSEGEFEPGANGKVLRNKLGIASEAEMAELETELLLKLYHYVFDSDIMLAKSLSSSTITDWHRKWLGNIYCWAGEFRSVNMSKGEVKFTAAEQVPKLMSQFSGEFLSQFANLPRMDSTTLIRYLAQSHIEFILIHPFREGNGRLSRLLLDVMAVKAGYQILDYGLWQQNRDYYFKSIQAGFAGELQYMMRLVKDILIDNA